MDFEKMEFPIRIPEFFPMPLNHVDFNEAFEAKLGEIAHLLPLRLCCQGGVPENDTLALEQFAYTGENPERFEGHAVVSFEEYDEKHFSDGTRRARLDFKYHPDSNLLLIRCRKVE